MKSRELHTTPDLIISNYEIVPISETKFRHSFTPKTTDTVYEFVANGAPEVEVGERYNIGYYIEDGKNIVDLSSLSKNTEDNYHFNYLCAKELSRGAHKINKGKNDERVNPSVVDGDYYWGKKYAWREFGLVVSPDVFHRYLNEIEHPQISCITSNPDMEYDHSPSIAYKEQGLVEAMDLLIRDARRVTKIFFDSPYYSKRFRIKGPNAITDKK